MIRRTFQDLCSSERKIEEDALDFVGTDKFAELVNLSGLEDPFVDKLLAHVRHTHDVTGYKAALKALDRYLLKSIKHFKFTMKEKLF